MTAIRYTKTSPPDADDRVIVENESNPAHRKAGTVLGMASSDDGQFRFALVRMDGDGDADWRAFDPSELLMVEDGATRRANGDA